MAETQINDDAMQSENTEYPQHIHSMANEDENKKISYTILLKNIAETFPSPVPPISFAFSSASLIHYYFGISFRMRK